MDALGQAASTPTAWYGGLSPSVRLPGLGEKGEDHQVVSLSLGLGGSGGLWGNWRGEGGAQREAGRETSAPTPRPAPSQSIYLTCGRYCTRR